MTDLRAQLVHGLNGHDVDPTIAWEIIDHWDAQEEVARAARAWTEILTSEWCADANPSDPDEIPPPWQQANLRDLYAALARLDGPR